MGIIAAHNNVEFETSDKLFSKIKRRLKSYNQAGLLDTNDFHDYVMDVLDSLGIGGLIEEQGVLEIVNGKAKLPENFKTLDGAYICEANSNTEHPRMQNGYVFYTDTTHETIRKDKCNISCDSVETGCKVTVREYIHGLERVHNYKLQFPLRITTYSTLGLNSNCASINNGYINVGFNSGSIYIKYYAYPIDLNTGLPMIPNVRSIQNAIELKVIYESLLNFYLNDEVPNVERKAADFKQLYNEAWSKASYETKLPSFATLVDSIRRKRKSLDVYRQTDQNT